MNGITIAAAAIILGTIMAASHNTTGDLVIGSVLVALGAIYFLVPNRRCK